MPLLVLLLLVGVATPASALSLPEFLRLSSDGRKQAIPPEVRDIQRSYGFGGKLPRSVVGNLLNEFSLPPVTAPSPSVSPGDKSPAQEPELADLTQPKYAALRQALAKSKAYLEIASEQGARVEFLTAPGMTSLQESMQGDSQPTPGEALACVRLVDGPAGNKMPVTSMNVDGLDQLLKERGPRDLDFLLYHERGHRLDIGHAPERDIPELPPTDFRHIDLARSDLRATRETKPLLDRHIDVLSGIKPGLPANFASPAYFIENSGERFANAYAWARTDPDSMQRAAPGLLEGIQAIGILPTEPSAPARTLSTPIPSPDRGLTVDRECEEGLSIRAIRAPDVPVVDTPLVGPAKQQWGSVDY